MQYIPERRLCRFRCQWQPWLGLLPSCQRQDCSSHRFHVAWQRELDSRLVLGACRIQSRRTCLASCWLLDIPCSHRGPFGSKCFGFGHGHGFRRQQVHRWLVVGWRRTSFGCCSSIAVVGTVVGAMSSHWGGSASICGSCLVQRSCHWRLVGNIWCWEMGNHFDRFVDHVEIGMSRGKIVSSLW